MSHGSRQAFTLAFASSSLSLLAVICCCCGGLTPTPPAKPSPSPIPPQAAAPRPSPGDSPEFPIGKPAFAGGLPAGAVVVGEWVPADNKWMRDKDVRKVYGGRVTI
jgi:hypothetical protein